MTIADFISRYLPRIWNALPPVTLPAVDFFIKPAYKPRYHFILDPGHGPLTTDKQSPPSPDGLIFKEAEGNRKILTALTGVLEDHGVLFSVTNDPELPGDSLVERVRRANATESELPRVFVSIHCNAAPPDRPGGWSTANGVETFYFTGSETGRHIASVVQHHLVTATGRRDRGVRHTDKFYVLRETLMPAVLGETLFMNNRQELLLLLDDEYLSEIANGYAQAILELDQDGIPGYPAFV